MDVNTKLRIELARNSLVGKVPDPKSQVEQITLALIYKFMDDMDAEAEELGGERTFFSGEYERYGWAKLMDLSLGGQETLNRYAEGIEKMKENTNIPQLFRDIFKNAFLPYRDPETLRIFLKIINEFQYDHSERLGDAFEYLLSVMDSQGKAGQFRTPRHIIDFMVDMVDPQKGDVILDPACGTAGFLISAFKHILDANSKEGRPGAGLSPDERTRLMNNISGYDISPDMVRLSLVNLYLHGFQTPLIHEYDTLTSEERWNEFADVIMANPPFMSPSGGIRPHHRFAIQSNRSEVLFVDYILEHLTPNGRAAVIVPEGIIFQSGIAYKALRKKLVDEDFLVGVISLPAGVFNPYSGVKTSIIWIDRTLAKKLDNIVFCKVENDGFDLGAQRRENTKNDLPLLLSTIHEVKIRSLDSSIEHDNPNLIIVKKRIITEKNYELNGERYRRNKADISFKWNYIPLGEICTFINGIAFKPEDWESKSNSNLPIIRIQNLNDNNAAFNYYSKPVEDKFYVNNGDLLFSWSGSRGTSFGAHIWKGTKGIVNQHIFRVLFSDQVTKEYLYLALNKAVSEVEENLHGGVGLVHITKGDLERIKIPVPPLEIQEELTNEISIYQKIIDGARMVVENYRPRIDVDPSWPVVKLGEVITLEYGKPLKSENRVKGDIPVFGSNGIVGYHNEALVLEPTIIVGRKGSAGAINYSEISCYPIDTTFYVSIKDPEKLDIKFCYYQMLDLSLDKVNVQSGVPGLNRNDAYDQQFFLPSIEEQTKIVSQIEEEERMVNGNKALIKAFENKIKGKIKRFWTD